MNCYLYSCGMSVMVIQYCLITLLVHVQRIKLIKIVQQTHQMTIQETIII